MPTLTKASEIAHFLEAWRSAERAVDAATDAHRRASEAAERAGEAADVARTFATAAAAALEASGMSAEVAAHQAEVAQVNVTVAEVVRHDAEEAIRTPLTPWKPRGGRTERWPTPSTPRNRNLSRRWNAGRPILHAAPTSTAHTCHNRGELLVDLAS